MAKKNQEMRDEGTVDATGTLAATVSRETLEATPPRVLSLLRGIGTNRAIRATFQAHGYRQDDQEEGWRLLHAASGYVEGEALIDGG